MRRSLAVVLFAFAVAVSTGTDDGKDVKEKIISVLRVPFYQRQSARKAAGNAKKRSSHMGRKIRMCSFCGESTHRLV